MGLVPRLVITPGLDAQKLLLVVPLIQRPSLVQALVALEADQFGAGRGSQRLGELRLAHPGRPFHEQRLAQPVGQEDGRGDRMVRKVTSRLQASADIRHIGEGMLL